MANVRVERHLNRDQQLAREDREVPLGLRRASAWAWRLVVLAGAAWLLIRVLGQISTVVIPVMVALLLASTLQPFVTWLSARTFLGRMGASAVVVLALVAGVVGMFTFATQQLTSSFDDIQTKAVAGFERASDWVTSTLKIDSSSLNTAVDNLVNELQNHTGQLAGGVWTGLTGLGVFLTGTFICLFTLLFLLAHGERIWRWVVGLLPAPSRVSVHESFRRGWRSLGGYVRTQVLVAAVDAFGIAIGVLALGLGGYAVPIWLIVFMSSFIPIIGAVVSGLVAVMLVLVLKSFWAAVIMLVIVLAVQQIEGNVLQPILMSKAVELHPLAVFLGVAVGGTVAGIPGALFVIPLMAFVNSTGLYLSGRDPAPSMGSDDLDSTDLALPPGPTLEEDDPTMLEEAVEDAVEDEEATSGATAASDEATKRRERNRGERS